LNRTLEEDEMRQRSTVRLMVTGTLALMFLCRMTAPVSGQQNALRQAPLRVVVNVPAARLDLWQEGGLVRSYSVAVGTRTFPTPIGEFELSQITWNPWWIPPASDWARDEKAQPPGERNPMGRVKLQFGDLYFMHGTADNSSIGRAASHGCIRMRNPDVLEFARFVLATADPSIPAALVDALASDPTRTQRFPLDCRVPVSIRYDLAEVRDTMLVLYADIYGRRPDLRTEVLAGLERAGFTISDLEPQQLERVLGNGRPRARKLPLRTLLRAEAWHRIQTREKN
jgi:murein L,D-transpeptidase YcbB/YkuD